MTSCLTRLYRFARAHSATRTRWLLALPLACAALLALPTASFAQTGGSPWENAVAVLTTRSGTARIAGDLEHRERRAAPAA